MDGCLCWECTEKTHHSLVDPLNEVPSLDEIVKHLCSSFPNYILQKRSGKGGQWTCLPLMVDRGKFMEEEGKHQGINRKENREGQLAVRENRSKFSSHLPCAKKRNNPQFLPWVSDGLEQILNIFSQSVESLSRVWLFETPQTAACQASLSITNSQSLLNILSNIY